MGFPNEQLEDYPMAKKPTYKELEQSVRGKRKRIK